jgi:hypothetical protein
MKITFSPVMEWSMLRGSILLHANADGKSIRCVVPQEFLTAPYVEPLDDENARAIFHKRKSEIEACLEARIHEGSFDPNGEIILHP